MIVSVPSAVSAVVSGCWNSVSFRLKTGARVNVCALKNAPARWARRAPEECPAERTRTRQTRKRCAALCKFSLKHWRFAHERTLKNASARRACRAPGRVSTVQAPRQTRKRCAALCKFSLKNWRFAHERTLKNASARRACLAPGRVSTVQAPRQTRRRCAVFCKFSLKNWRFADVCALKNAPARRARRAPDACRRCKRPDRPESVVRYSASFRLTHTDRFSPGCHGLSRQGG
jgi:hypothetical protein